MKITAETTDAQIKAQVTRAKDNLFTLTAAAVESDYMEGEKLVHAAQAVRNAEELSQVQYQYRDLCKNDPDGRLKFLFHTVCRRDDTWSGRRNDSTRSSRDAIIDWAQSEVVSIRF